MPLGVSSSVGLLRGSDSGRNLFTWGGHRYVGCVCRSVHCEAFPHTPTLFSEVEVSQWNLAP